MCSSDLPSELCGQLWNGWQLVEDNGLSLCKREAWARPTSYFNLLALIPPSPIMSHIMLKNLSSIFLEGLRWRMLSLLCKMIHWQGSKFSCVTIHGRGNQCCWLAGVSTRLSRNELSRCHSIWIEISINYKELGKASHSPKYCNISAGEASRLYRFWKYQGGCTSRKIWNQNHVLKHLLYRILNEKGLMILKSMW